jgi:hypothetical protein
MPHITLHLDDATHTLAKQAALASGLSTSRWVANLIRAQLANTWLAHCWAMAGRFADFPLCGPPLSTTHDLPHLQL